MTFAYKEQYYFQSMCAISMRCVILGGKKTFKCDFKNIYSKSKLFQFTLQCEFDFLKKNQNFDTLEKMVDVRIQS